LPRADHGQKTNLILYGPSRLLETTSSRKQGIRHCCKAAIGPNSAIYAFLQRHHLKQCSAKKREATDTTESVALRIPWYNAYTKNGQAFAMPRSNGIAIRDERGRYLKGRPGGPGRPLGSRNKLTEDFLADMHAAWLEHGQNVIDRLITERPDVFLLAMLKIAQVHRVEVGRPSEFDRPCSRDEALRVLEERHGPVARKMFKNFLTKMDKLEKSGLLAGA
jgi:hypothetical protein